MAALVLTTAKIQVGTAWTGTSPGLPGTQTVAGTITTPTDISGYCKQVGLPLAVATQDATTFGSGGFVVNVPGLKSTQVGLSFVNDLAASALDSILWGFGMGTTLYVDVMPTSAARGTSNPSYVFAVILASYNPITASVGALNAFDVTWPSTGAFSRLTA